MREETLLLGQGNHLMNEGNDQQTRTIVRDIGSFELSRIGRTGNITLAVDVAAAGYGPDDISSS